MLPPVQKPARIPTGLPGLDEILGGGLPARRFFLIQGNPGSGKTTLGLQFLLEGHRRGERVLYVSLSETHDELFEVAASHGWDLSGVPLFELAAGEQHLALDQQNTLFEPSEVELAEVTRRLLAEVEKVNPVRVVFDSLSEMRLLAQNALRYRRHLLGLKQYFVGRGCTVLLMDDRTSEPGDLQLQSLAHGVIELEQLAPLYGPERRRLRVAKMRGVAYRGGYHDFRLLRGGLEIYTRLVAAEHNEPVPLEVAPSAMPELDELMGGGLDRGTSTLFIGPAGSGKSTLALQYAGAAARRGESAAAYLFDEGMGTFVARSKALGTPVDELMRAGKLRVQQIDPAEMSPGQFVHTIRADVERRDVRVVVIDSLNGYLLAMPEEQSLLIQMHELVSYLRQRGVVTVLVVAQAGMVGHMQAPVDLSYLADTVVLLRFFEEGGRVRKAISVLKRRSGHHSNEIRDLTISTAGIGVGERLQGLEGVLTGVPRALPKS
ncbi:MAG: ATPase domain-containing protein [Myxococcales bacterium]